MYILTAICPSSHFCWAIPLRTSTASVVADGLISVFKDSGIPREILTDRGTQFSSKIVKHVCSHFGIHQLKTASYCPQSNGILERFHATLASVIRKSCKLRINWAKQLDLAIFALRNVPHRDHNFTPFELVFGRRIHHVISYLASIWRGDLSGGLDTCTYMADLQDRLEVIRTEMAARTSEAKQSAREKQDHKYLRHFSVGEKVLFRIPGLSNT